MNKVRVFIFLLFLPSADTIFGCMCGHASISEMYQESDVIVTARVIGFKPTTVYEDRIIYENGDEKKGKEVPNESSGQAVQLKIIKWFKGTNRKQLINLSQPNSTCDWSFEKKHLNKQFLFYLSFNKKYKTYNIISCGRSNPLQKAADDLSWLKGLPKSLNRTRISGVVQFNDDENLFPGVGGIKIKITGNGKEYNRVSDKNGVYEIWDLPEGIYTINAEMPEDKKLGWTTSVPDDWTYFWSNDEPNNEALKVTLKPKNTAGMDFMLENK